MLSNTSCVKSESPKNSSICEAASTLPLIMLGHAAVKSTLSPHSGSACANAEKCNGGPVSGAEDASISIPEAESRRVALGTLWVHTKTQLHYQRFSMLYITFGSAGVRGQFIYSQLPVSSSGDGIVHMAIIHPLPQYQRALSSVVACLFWLGCHKLNPALSSTAALIPSLRGAPGWVCALGHWNGGSRAPASGCLELSGCRTLVQERYQCHQPG